MLVRDHRIYVDGYLNGKGPFRFLFDTGGRFVISKHVAAIVSSKTVGSSSVRGAGSSASLSATDVDIQDVRFGSAHMSKQRFTILDLPASYQYSAVGRPFAGIVGRELLATFRTTLDFDRNTFVLDASSGAMPGSSRLAFDDAGHPIVPSTIAGASAHLVVDTGYPGPALDIFDSFAKRHGLLRRYPPHFSVVIGRGLGGYVRGAITRVPAIALGNGVTLHDTVVAYSSGEEGVVGSAVDGFLTEAILECCNVTFDYRARSVRLTPRNSSFRATFDRSGMYVQKDAPEAFSVVDVVRNGPAWNAGVRAADKIMSVDNRPATLVTLAAFHDLTRQASGTKVKLTYRHGRKTNEATIVLRDLV